MITTPPGISPASTACSMMASTAAKRSAGAELVGETFLPDWQSARDEPKIARAAANTQKTIGRHFGHSEVNEAPPRICTAAGCISFPLHGKLYADVAGCCAKHSNSCIRVKRQSRWGVVIGAVCVR